MHNKSFHIALRTSLLYAVIAFIWILFSDQIIALVFKNPEEITKLQTCKGLFFAIIATGILYHFLRIQLKQWGQEFYNREKTEQELHEKEAEIASIFRAAPVGIGINLNRVFLEVNDNLCKMLGYAHDELVGQNARIIYPTQEDYDFVGKEKYAQIKELGTGTVKTRWMRKDGSILHILLRSTPMDMDKPEKGVTFAALDITKSVEDEEALLGSQEYLQAVLDSTHDALVIHDAETGQIIDVNQRMCEMYGCSYEDALKSNLNEFSQGVPPYAEKDAISWLQKAREAGHQTFEWLARHKDGHLFWAEVSIRLATIGGKNRFVVSVRDINNRKNIENMLRENERSLKTLMSNLPGMVYRCKNDPDWTMEYASEGAFALLGFRPSDLINNKGIAFRQIIHPEDRQAVWNEIQSALQSYRPYTLTYRIIDASNIEKWVWEQGRGYFDENDELLYLEGFITDISERKQAEEQLRISQETYQRILSSITEAVYIQDKNGLFLDVNDAAKKLYGYEREDFIGKTPEFLSAPEKNDMSMVLKAAQKAYQNQPQQFEFWGRKKSGEIFPKDVSLTQGWYFGQKVIIAVARDISERKQAEENLSRHKHQLEILARATQVVNQKLEHTFIMRNLVKTAIELVAAQDGTAGTLIDGQMIFTEYHQGGTIIPIDYRFDSGYGVPGWVMQTRKPYLSNDAENDLHVIPEIQKALGFYNLADVPILGREGELLGCFEIHNSLEKRPFDENDLIMLEGLAASAAIAFENAKMLYNIQQTDRELKQRLSELESLQTSSSTLNSAHNLSDAANILMSQALSLVKATAGAIWLYHPQSNQLEIATSCGWPDSLISHSVPPTEGIIGKVFSSGESYLSQEFASDIQTYDLFRPKIPQGWGGACVPIGAGNEIIGVLYVSAPTPYQLFAEQIKLLKTLAEMAGATLQRIRLYEDTRRHLERLQALREIDRAITSSFDLRITLDILLKQATNKLGADAADILLMDTDLQELKYSAGSGFHTHDIEKAHVRIGQGFAGRIVLECRSLNITDENEVKKNKAFAKLWTDEGFKFYYGVPLQAKGKVRGVLEVFHRDQLLPDPDWINFVENLANQTAIAIDNAKMFETLQYKNLELAIAYDATIEGWAHALEMREGEPIGHTERITELTLELAQEMGIRDNEILALRRGVLLHDVGKMGIPDSILLKAGPLTPEERRLIENHPHIAYEMLSKINFLRPALAIPYYHHEKWDGTGYPDSLRGQQIPFTARLFAVVDVWDALTHDRPYRKAWTQSKALKYIKEQRGKHFDPEIADVFLRLRK